MNRLDARLIELNQALLKLTTGENKVNNENQPMLDKAIQAMSGIDTGPGNDTIIINNSPEDCNCPPGPPGPAGPQGPQGEPGPQGPAGECDCKVDTILIDKDYYANSNNFYIGVDSDSPVTVFLPEKPEDGTIITIKSEMKPPMGNRKITVKSVTTELIDGYSEYTIQVSHEFVTVIYRGDGWHIIG